MQKAAEWEKHLGLEPHPEGGSYRETYTCPKKAGGRSLATSIYFLLKKGERSNLHRLDADEMWYHLDGQALTIHAFNEKGVYTKHRLGTNPRSGEEPWLLLPAGAVFGAEPAPGTDFCLCGCVVTPGFLFKHFELFDRETLLGMFPDQTDIVTRLTPET